jgi:hypothetical protein
MNLPIRAQKLISEYAKPVTSPDWRKRKNITIRTIYHYFLKKRPTKLREIFIRNMFNTVPVHQLLGYIRYYGVTYTSKAFHISERNISILNEYV